MHQDDRANQTSSWLFVGPSKISGTGLFSRKTILKGDFVGELCGLVLPVATKRTIQMDRNRHLCSDYIDYINHCCRPNAYVQVEGDSIVLNAIEEIVSERDEITIDYNCSEYWLAESFMCRCCHPRSCIYGYRYLLEENQEDYLRRIDRFLLPYLVTIRSTYNPAERAFIKRHPV